MKIFRTAFIAMLALATFASCSSDDDDDKVIVGEDESTVQLVFKTTQEGNILPPEMPATYAEEGENTSPLKLDNMFINIAEIEFEVTDEMEDKGYSDKELKGPFAIDLLSDKASEGWTLSTTNVPNGTYEELEFEFDVYEGKDEDFAKLVGNTIYASGKFDLGLMEVPFTIKSDEELEIELEYENKPLVLDGDKSKVFIELNINTVLSNLIESILPIIESGDIELEEDGSIIIDKEKNTKILEKFEDALEAAFEAIEDAHEGDDKDEDDN